MRPVITVQGIRERLRKRSEIWRTFEQKLQRVIERDGDFQRARYDRGGTLTSTLSQDAQAVAGRIMRKRDAEIESLGASDRPAIVQGHSELLTRAATAAAATATEIRNLQPFEAAMVEFFHATQQPQRSTAGDQDLALALERFVLRIQQIQAPQPAARPAQYVPVRPDFADLLQ